MTYSYWQSPQRTPFSSLQQNKEQVDAVVIGGGLTGLFTAYWLKYLYPDSYKSVVILEREQLFAGASGRNAGFLTSGSAFYFQSLVERFGWEKAVQIWRFSELNIEQTKKHFITTTEESQNLDYSFQGAHTLTVHDSETKRLQEAYELLKKADIDCQFLSGEDLHHRLSSPLPTAGIFIKQEGQIHPMFLARHIWKRLQSYQVSLSLQEEVYHTEPMTSSPHSILVSTNLRQWETKKLFITTNAYLPWCLPHLQETITPLRSQVLLTRPLSTLHVPGPCYIPSLRVYYRQLPSKEILIGGMRHLDPQHSPHHCLVTHDVQDALLNLLQQLFPQAATEKQQSWSGIMGFTQNEWPVSGIIPTLNQHGYYLGGFSGHGMGYAFLMSRRLVRFAHQEGPHPTEGSLREDLP
jgi:glycine/D-amino acid oxidase-like deaminating enzyme